MQLERMLDDGLVAARSHSCWCRACSRVRGRVSLVPDFGGVNRVPGCERTNLTVWRTKPRLTSMAAAGIANHRTFEKDLWANKLRSKVAPGKFGYVQADALWSEAERKHLRPGHGWLFEFGDAGEGKGSFKQSFKMAPKSWQLYEGTCFYDGEAALVVKRWFHRIDDDASGCTFVEWDPKADAKPGAPPVAMLINSSKLRGVFGSDRFKKIMPPALDLGPFAGTRHAGAAVRELEGVGQIRYVLHPDTDSESRDRCVAAGAAL